MANTEKAREKLLLAALYSVERMNYHILEGNSQAAFAERTLQENLRCNFEDLSEDRRDA